MKKSTIKKAVAMFLTLIILYSVAIPVNAANTKTYYTGGSTYSSKTFTVTTDKATTLTFSQKKGSLSYVNLVGQSKTMDAYASYVIEYKPAGGKWQSIEFTGANTSLKLKGNTSYTIRVKQKSMSDYQWRYGYIILRSITGWKTHASWTVKAPNVRSLK